MILYAKLFNKAIFRLLKPDDTHPYLPNLGNLKL